MTTKHDTKEALKPCPFCGSAAEYIRIDADEHLVRCAGQCQTGTSEREHLAVEAWNTRADHSQELAQLRRFRREVEKIFKEAEAKFNSPSPSLDGLLMVVAIHTALAECKESQPVDERAELEKKL